MSPVASTAPMVAAQLVVGILLLPLPRRQRIPAAAGLSSLSLSFSLLTLLFFQENKPQARFFHTADPREAPGYASWHAVPQRAELGAPCHTAVKLPPCGYSALKHRSCLWLSLDCSCLSPRMILRGQLQAKRSNFGFIVTQ